MVRLRDALFFIGGSWIGWHMDVASRVDGVSMRPTLTPGDLIMHIPQRLWAAVGAIAQVDPSASLLGRVVVVQVAPSTKVCKRVVGVAPNAVDVAVVHDARFQSIEHSSVRSWANDDDDGDDAVGKHDGTNADAPVEVGRQQTTDCDNDEDHHGLHAASADWHCIDERPFRRSDWDWCIDKGTVGTAPLNGSTAWLWIEGDNANESFDSRHVGYVPIECVTGVVVGRLWPNPSAVQRRPRVD